MEESVKKVNKTASDKGGTSQKASCIWQLLQIGIAAATGEISGSRVRQLSNVTASW